MTRKLPEPHDGSNTLIFAMRLRKLRSFRGLSLCLPKAGAQIVQKQRIEDLEDVRHRGVVHAERAAFLVLRDRLDHRPEDVRVDFGPVEAADMQR